jgi:hypothetical protein
MRVIGLQTLALGLESPEVAHACDILQQMCLLHNHLVENILEEGTLWMLLRLLFDFDVCLKSRRQSEPCTSKDRFNTSPPPSGSHLRFDITQDLTSSPCHRNKLQKAGSKASTLENLEGRPHAIDSIPLVASVACAAMSTLTSLLDNSSAAQEAFLLLGGVSVVLSMLAEFQVCSDFLDASTLLLDALFAETLEYVRRHLLAIPSLPHRVVDI